ncbi:MAG: GreA/GreB family elongation factor [Flavobacteriales bacterium]|nr:GreA/GreB family elongation factor [Flavobacteriales bacterium]
MQKAIVVDQLNRLLEERIRSLKDELATTLEARNSDTKSSAGDKHEVGRAMVQQELDQLEAQLAKTQAMQQELARVPFDRAYEQVAFGSLITTDQGQYFIAIGLGAVEFVDETRYAISLASPIGQALKDKRVGDVVTFNGRSIRITAIA